MHPTFRPCAGEVDLPKLLDFASGMHRAGWRPAFFQPSEIIWSVYRADGFDFGRIGLWEADGGDLAGFAWLDAPDELCLQVDPRRQDGDTLEEALAWAWRRSPSTAMGVRCSAGNSAQLAWLDAHGFARDAAAPALVLLGRDISGPVPAAAPPPGFSVRHVGGEEEWPARVELHREVWHPSRVTLEAYRRLRTVEGYTPELDLVVVAPDGMLAAYALVWIDPATGVGNFEPVGTGVAYRGMGLGRVVMLEGLRRLRDCGAHTATVITSAANPAALRLYQSVGFVEAAREYLYRAG